MNFFHTILQKIGLEKPAAPAAPAAPVAVPYTPVSSVPAAAPYTPVSSAPVAPAPAPASVDPATFVPAAVGFSAPPSSSTASYTAAPAQAKQAAVSMVDVLSKLEGMAKSHPELDWKVSIVDMLKLLDMDSSFEARKALAVELDCPADMMSDSARMNIWLHKTVLQKIAENGGNIPDSLLH